MAMGVIMPEARQRDREFGARIGRRVSELRKQLDLSLHDVAKRVFLSPQDVREIESGRPVSLAVLRRVAEALGAQPHDLLSADSVEFHSVFLSYGGPDQAVAGHFFEWLDSRGVNCFFFPESATPGVRIHRTMSEGVAAFDRIVLLCSVHSLDRPGVMYELEQVLSREADEGGSELLIPVALDDFIWAWRPSKPDIARQVRARVVADYREVLSNSEAFDHQMNRLLRALRRPRKSAVLSTLRNGQPPVGSRADCLLHKDANDNVVGLWVATGAVAIDKANLLALVDRFESSGERVGTWVRVAINAGKFRVYQETQSGRTGDLVTFG